MDGEKWGWNEKGRIKDRIGEKRNFEREKESGNYERKDERWEGWKWEERDWKNDRRICKKKKIGWVEKEEMN